MDRTERNIKLSSCTATLEHGGHWRQRNVSLVVHSVEQVLCYIHKFKETPAAVQPAVAYLCKTISCNTVQTLLMMSENMARNMQSSQGIKHYPTQLHLVGHFRKLYHDARNHEYEKSDMFSVSRGTYQLQPVNILRTGDADLRF